MNTSKKYCGIALTPRRIVAALNGPGGESEPFRVPRTHTARYDMLAAIGVTPCALVIDDVTWRQEPIGEVASMTGCDVWVAPSGILAAVLAVSAVPDSPSRRAQILSRLTQHPWTRAYLRLIRASPNKNQQELW